MTHSEGLPYLQLTPIKEKVIEKIKKIKSKGRSERAVRTRFTYEMW